MNTGRQDIYQRVTNEIVGAIEKGAGSFHMPWHTSGDFNFSPVNAQSKKPYRGINILILAAAAERHGFKSGHWATYRQWQELGAQVRKCEKARSVVFWKFTDFQQETEDGETEGNAKGKRIPFAREYWVFNADQVDAYTAPAVPTLSEGERIERADSFVAGVGADIRHGGNRAFYSPQTDHVQMPPFANSKHPLGYYSTLTHELTHWTGSESRLSRNLQGRFGDHAYAIEELIAELGAAFLCADLGFGSEPRGSHAVYIESWLKALRNDKKAIFTAAGKAQAAADWIHSRVAEREAA